MTSLEDLAAHIRQVERDLGQLSSTLMDIRNKALQLEDRAGWGIAGAVEDFDRFLEAAPAHLASLNKQVQNEVENARYRAAVSVMDALCPRR